MIASNTVFLTFLCECKLFTVSFTSPHTVFQEETTASHSTNACLSDTIILLKIFSLIDMCP